MGRSADIDDVITNFLGGLIGYILFLAFNKLLKNTNFWKNLLKMRYKYECINKRSFINEWSFII